MKNKNELAFPARFPTGEEAYPGMTLRDYFAAQMLQSVSISHLFANGDWHGKRIAEDIYKMADAMLEERHEKILNEIKEL